MIQIEKSKRWPLIIVLILGTTISVNVFFAWIALSDHDGGFELVTGNADDSSYKRKLPLDASEKY